MIGDFDPNWQLPMATENPLSNHFAGQMNPLGFFFGDPGRVSFFFFRLSFFLFIIYSATGRIQIFPSSSIVDV